MSVWLSSWWGERKAAQGGGVQAGGGGVGVEQQVEGGCWPPPWVEGVGSWVPFTRQAGFTSSSGLPLSHRT